MFQNIFAPLNENVFTGFNEAEYSTLNNGLIESWRLDESSGQRVGRVNGYVFNDVNTVGVGAGILHNAASMVRVNTEYLSIDPAVNGQFTFSNRSYSLSIWYNLTTLPASNFYTIIGKRGDTLPYSYVIYLQHTGGTSYNLIYLHYNSAGTASTNIILPVTPATNQWEFLCAQYNHEEQTQTLHYNADTPTTIASAAGSSASGAQLYLGLYRLGAPNTPDARLYEFNAWNRAISRSEVLSVYNNGNSNPWPFGS